MSLIPIFNIVVFGVGTAIALIEYYVEIKPRDSKPLNWLMKPIKKQ